jgi:anti-sigma B factor antagonist
VTGAPENEPGVKSQLRLDVSQAAGAVIVTVQGEIDLFTAPRLQAAVSDCRDSADGLVVLDLTNVTFLGSHGLATLVRATQESTSSKHIAPVRLAVDDNQHVLRPIQIARLDAVLALYHSVDEALAP